MILTECVITSVSYHLNAEVDSLCIMSAIVRMFGAIPNAGTHNGCMRMDECGLVLLLW